MREVATVIYPDGLSVHRDCGMTGRILCELACGDEVDVINQRALEQYVWLQVRTRDKPPVVGWIAGYPRVGTTGRTYVKVSRYPDPEPKPNVVEHKERLGVGFWICVAIAVALMAVALAMIPR